MNVLGFLTDSHYIDNDSHAVSPGFELSTQSQTYAKDITKQQATGYSSQRLHVFSSDLVDSSDNPRTVTHDETKAILYIIDQFINRATTSGIDAIKNILITDVLNILGGNTQSTLDAAVTHLDYTELVEVESNNLTPSIIIPKEIQFTISGRFSTRIWLSDSSFQASYPLYDIDLVLPFSDFESLFHDAAFSQNGVDAFIDALGNVDPEVMSSRIEQAKTQDLGGGSRVYTPSVSKVINVPFMLGTAPSSGNITQGTPCYFGFNIYGMQGAFGDILREKIRDYLLSIPGVTDEIIDTHFPSLNQVNEYFFIPRWDRLAIPAQLSNQGTYSHVIPFYHDDFDLTDYFNVYGADTASYLQNPPDSGQDDRGPNVFYAPVKIRNLLLVAINGKYTESGKRIFWEYYDDFISGNSSAIDFDALKSRTQILIHILERLVEVGVKGDALQAFNKALSFAPTYHIRLRTRNGVQYIVTQIENTYIYLMPRYEFERIKEDIDDVS